MAASDHRAVRPRTLGPAVAGSWYPASAAALRQQVDAMLAPSGSTLPETARPLRAVIAPHAGFVYSGGVAGRVFRHAAGQAVRRVLLIGPSHYASFRGAALPASEAYATPLGPVRIDSAAIGRLASHDGFQVDDAPFRPEHCLEAEIPFLQRVLGDAWTLIPVLIGGGTTGRETPRYADALASVLDGATLVVVSSDFTHYGPRFGYVPFRDRVAERIRELDMGAVERIVALDRPGFEDYLARTGATICGRAPIGLLLDMTEPGGRAELVSYETSGEITGDWEHSVSYAGIAVYAHGNNGNVADAR